MNEQSQEVFEQLVKQYYEQHKNSLRLSDPEFVHRGFVMKAILLGDQGSVEILSGPPEYHAELLIKLFGGKKRLNLADLMSFDPVREWLIAYSKKAVLKGKSTLESDIEWIFLILIDGLKEVPNFVWLHS